MPSQAVQLGLDAAKQIEIQWGFQDDAVVSVLGVVAPSPRQGILALLDQPTFTIRSLPEVPAGLSGFTALSIDLEKTFDKIVALMKKTNRPAADQVPGTVDMFRQRFGFDLHRDVFPSLGPKLAVYAQPPAAQAGPDPATAMLSQFAGLTVAAQVRDEAAACQIIRSADADSQRSATGAAPAPNAPALAFRKEDGRRPTYVLDLPHGALPPQILEMFRPTVTFGNGQLVFAASTDAAQRAIAASDTRQGRRWQASGAFVPMARRLPENLVFLNVSDPRETFPALIENLPALVPQLNRLLPPAAQAAGEAGDPGANAPPRQSVPAGAAGALHSRSGQSASRFGVEAPALPRVDRDSLSTAGCSLRRSRIDPQRQLAGHDRRPRSGSCCRLCRPPARPRGAPVRKQPQADRSGHAQLCQQPTTPSRGPPSPNARARPS